MNYFAMQDNVLDNQLKLDQSAALQGQTRQGALNAFTDGVGSLMNAPAQNALRDNAVTQSNVQTAQAERALIAPLLDGVARSNDPARAYAQAVQRVQAAGIDIPDELETYDPQNFQLLQSIYAMPAEKLTDFQRQVQMLGDPVAARQAAMVALGLSPNAGDVFTAQNRTTSVGPGTTVLDANNQPVFTAPSKPQSDPKLVQQAQFLFPNDLSAQRAYVQRVSEKPDTAINIGGEGEWNKQMAKRYAGRYDEVLQGAEAAQLSLNTFQEMRSVLGNPDVYTGAGGEWLLQGKKLLGALGIDAAGVQDTESFMAMANNMTLTALGNLKGVASDTDMRVVQGTAAQLTDTREGNLSKIDVAERAAQYQIRMARKMSEYVAQNGQVDEGWISVMMAESAAFRDEMMQKIQQSAGFEGHTSDSIKNIVKGLRSEGRTETEIKDILFDRGLLKRPEASQ